MATARGRCANSERVAAGPAHRSAPSTNSQMQLTSAERSDSRPAPLRSDSFRSPRGARESSHRARGVLAAHAEHLPDARDGLALPVHDRYLEKGVDLSLQVGLGAQLVDASARQLEPSIHLPPPRLEELDRCALVPDHVPVSELHHEHEHEERIAHRVERASELRPDEVAIPVGELHLHLEDAQVLRDPGHGDASAEVRRVEAQELEEAVVPEPSRDPLEEAHAGRSDQSTDSPSYMESISFLYFCVHAFRLTFIVGVSSPVSCAKSWSSTVNRLIVS